MSPRPRKNSTDVAGLYEKFDRRTGRVYYQYKNPVTGKFHGLGTDKGKAEKIASTANQRIAAAEAEYFMRKIDESPSATKRRGIRLKAWVDRYLKIQDTRLKNGDIAATTHKEKARMAAYLVSRLGNHPLKELEVRDFALILDEWLDKDMVSTARVNRGLWVDIYKEAQHAGEVPPGWNPPEATRKPIPKVTRARLTLEDWQKFTTQRLKNTLSVTQCFLRLLLVSAVMTFATCVFQMCGTNTCISPREKPECVWRYRLHYAVMPLG